MKKFLAMTMALAMVLSLAACGKKDEPAPSGSASPRSPPALPGVRALRPLCTTVEAGKLHMATNAAFPPYEMTTDDGRLRGHRCRGGQRHRPEAGPGAGGGRHGL